MDNVVPFPGLTYFVVDEDGGTAPLDLPAENVLNGAAEANLRDVIVVGREKETDEFYIASTSNNVSKIVYFLELAKMKFLTIGDAE